MSKPWLVSMEDNHDNNIELTYGYSAIVVLADTPEQAVALAWDTLSKNEWLAFRIGERHNLCARPVTETPILIIGCD